MKKTFLLLVLFAVLIWGCNSSDSTGPSGNNGSTEFSEYDYELQLNLIQVPYIDGTRSYGYSTIFFRCKDNEELTNFTCSINNVQCNTEWVIYTLSDRKGYNIWGIEMVEDSTYTVSIQSDEITKELTVTLPSVTTANWPTDFDSALDFSVNWTSELDSDLQRLYLTCYDDGYINQKDYVYEIDPSQRSHVISANSISSMYTTHEFELRRINYVSSGEFVLTARILDKMSYSCSIC